MAISSKQGSYVRTQLRLPNDLHLALTAAAVRNGRSLNAEILHRLQNDPVLHGIETIIHQNVELKELVRKVLDNIDP